ncbi:MAG: hypothetical protein Q8P81_02055 [Nanoarchaeota archaeon]|nr:hypothetical protein [Nanoarchaeota archaeon]
MGLDLSKIKERLAVASGQKKAGDSSNTFWKIPQGESVARIVPTPDGDPFREHFQHYNVGKSMPFLCPRKQFGEQCPVCEYVNKLFKSSNEDDIALAKKIMSKPRYFSPVMVRGEEDKGLRWWSYSKTTYVKLLKLVNRTDEYGDITDPEHGTDLVISYSTPKGASFPITDFEPRRKESPICKDLTDDRCKELLETIPDLEKSLNRKSSSDIQKALNEWILGNDSEEHGEQVSVKEIEKFGVVEAKSPQNDIDACFDELMK